MRSYSFTKTISMGQHQCPKCERQFARSDSLRRHLTSGICSEDMESETMSKNEDSAMSEESDAETSRSHQKEDIFGKYTDKDYGLHHLHQYSLYHFRHEYHNLCLYISKRYLPFDDF